MRDSKANRSVIFRQAYWRRIEELVDLLDRAGRDQAVSAARSAKLGRKTCKRFSETVHATPPGPLSIDEVDQVAKRYGRWEARRVFDRGSYPPNVRPDTRRIDEALWSGIYELDVTLRRQVEDLLRSPAPERLGDAVALRTRVETGAARLAAALDLADSAEQHHPDWATIGDDYDTVCNELDTLLVLAGAPRSSA